MLTTWPLDSACSVQFCKEVLSLDDAQIVYTKGDFFVDSPGSSAALASALAESMDAVASKHPLPLSRESSGGVNGTPKRVQKPSENLWNLVPFKRTTELFLLESKLKGRIKVMSESPEWLNGHTNGGLLHRHVSTRNAHSFHCSSP